MRVAIPLSDDGIARSFDTAARLLVVDFIGSSSIERAEAPTFVGSPDGRANEFVSLGVHLLLCQRISHATAVHIREKEIDIETPVSMDVDDAVSYIPRHQSVRESRRTSAA